MWNVVIPKSFKKKSIMSPVSETTDLPLISKANIDSLLCMIIK